jgi:hypothetical protein
MGGFLLKSATLSSFVTIQNTITDTIRCCMKKWLSGESLLCKPRVTLVTMFSSITGYPGNPQRCESPVSRASIAGICTGRWYDPRRQVACTPLTQMSLTSEGCDNSAAIFKGQRLNNSEPAVIVTLCAFRNLFVHYIVR